MRQRVQWEFSRISKIHEKEFDCPSEGVAHAS
jgi:hypothetical protein